MEKTGLREKFALIDEHWRPKVVARINGQEVKLAKLLEFTGLGISMGMSYFVKFIVDTLLVRTINPDASVLDREPNLVAAIGCNR